MVIVDDLLHMETEMMFCDQELAGPARDFWDLDDPLSGLISPTLKMSYLTDRGSQGYCPRKRLACHCKVSGSVVDSYVSKVPRCGTISIYLRSAAVPSRQFEVHHVS